MQPCGVGKHVDGRDGRGGLQDFAGDGGERRAAALGGKGFGKKDCNKTDLGRSESR